MRSDLQKQPTPGAVIFFIFSLLILFLRSAPAQSVILQLPPDDRQMITALLGPGVVGKALPSKPINETSIYFPLRDAASIYHVKAGPNAGKTQTLGVA